MENDAERMTHLSSMLDMCADVINGDMVFLDYPLHGNIGDLLIWKGTEVFFKRHKKRILGQYSIHNTGTGAERLIDKCPTICCHGGGNLGDLWANHQKYREDIIKRYPNKRIVILPQSVHFDSLGALSEACTVFKGHPDLHIFLRDKKSYAILADKSVVNLRLCPDMAHALWGTISAQNPVISHPLYLMRRDKEKVGYIDAANPFDWEEILHHPPLMRRALRINQKLHAMDMKAGNTLPARFAWNMAVNRMIAKAIRLFGAHQEIITDRLHAVILSALLQRKVTAYDNSYGKISSYIEAWMSNMANISFKVGI